MATGGFRLGDWGDKEARSVGELERELCVKSSANVISDWSRCAEESLCVVEGEDVAKLFEEFEESAEDSRMF